MKKTENKETKCNMLCAYCNARWTGKMITQLTNTEYERGFYEDIEGVETTTMLKIHCDNCGKLLYAKEIVCRSDDYLGKLQ